MKAAELVESRTPQWRQLEALCAQLESRGDRRRLGANRRTEFAKLYRCACADLALADAHQLPGETVRYLHQLVGRAHNQLYRTRGLESDSWADELFERVPRRLFRDNSLRLAAVIFWGGFLLSAFLASEFTPVPQFAEQVLGKDSMMSLDTMYSEPIGAGGRSGNDSSAMAGFYIFNNAGIGLRCFAMGIIFGVGGMFALAFNAVFLGAAFGYMSTTPHSENFFNFVTAHGPFELTAIVMSGAAGMRLGFALVHTGGLSRLESVTAASRRALPTMMAAVLLFVGAAFIEGFVSPSGIPYAFKALVAMITTLLLLVYLVALGYSADEPDDDEQRALD